MIEVIKDNADVKKGAKNLKRAKHRLYRCLELVDTNLVAKSFKDSFQIKLRGSFLIAAGLSSAIAVNDLPDKVFHCWGILGENHINSAQSSLLQFFL